MAAGEKDLRIADGIPIIYETILSTLWRLDIPEARAGEIIKQLVNPTPPPISETELTPEINDLINKLI